MALDVEKELPLEDEYNYTEIYGSVQRYAYIQHSKPFIQALRTLNLPPMAVEKSNIRMLRLVLLLEMHNW